MAGLNQRLKMLFIASAAFLVLQLTTVVPAATWREDLPTVKASFYNPPYVPNVCFGSWGVPEDHFHARGPDTRNARIWNGGKHCNGYFSVKCVGDGCRNDGGPIKVKIIDRNNGYNDPEFELSAEAFAAIADPDVGTITVEYELVPIGGDAVPFSKEKLIAEVGLM